MSFRDQLNHFTTVINSGLDSLFSEIQLPQRRLLEAMRYSLLAGGKRLRPILTLATANCLGCDLNPLNLALAIELIHTYSLVHDDLPAMDNDNLRRGVATAHVKFDESTAILSGDSLLTHAFYLITVSGLTDEQKVSAVRCLSDAAGVYGLTGGQQLDMESEANTVDRLMHMQSLKTGALIRAAVSLGAIAASRPSDILDEYAYHLGIAFQITDDILDATATSQQLGKGTKRDGALNKKTAVTLLGRKEASALAQKHSRLAIDIANENCCTFLAQLAQFLSGRIR